MHTYSIYEITDKMMDHPVTTMCANAMANE